MRKTRLDYTAQGSPAGWYYEMGNPDAPDYLRLHFAHHVVKQLDDAGYTAHPDTVLDLVEVTDRTTRPALHFPPYRPTTGAELVLVGGPAHGEVRRVGVDPLASILVVPQGAPARVYVFAGLNVATGAWEWADGGEA